MRVVTFIILFLISLVAVQAQRPTKTNEVVTKTEKVKLQQLVIEDTSFITTIDSLSRNTTYPLNLNAKGNNILYLNIFLSCQDSNILYSIHLTKEKQFVYRKGIWGFFEIGKTMFVIQGDNIPELFKFTGKLKPFNYTTPLGYKMTDGSILPMATVDINDSQVALVYTYAEGKIELQQIIEGY